MNASFAVLRFVLRFKFLKFKLFVRREVSLSTHS